ncbi:MAG: phosphopyruvate hydratase, partial [Candidatus Vogelbacteria bacterium]|nr:phosphopyruvate hydratase [Candidatus Vogelbacteria bacterium]
NYHKGKGVYMAIKNVNDLVATALKGMDIVNQRKIDDTLIVLDGTKNKSRLGGNTTIGVSIAAAKCAAQVSGVKTFEYLRTLATIKPSRKTPFLFMNLINGGMHAKTKLAFQEYHIVPQTEDILLAFKMGCEIQLKLRDIIIKEMGVRELRVGDEGGYALDVESVSRPLKILRSAVYVAGYGENVRFALDVASSSFFDRGLYKVGNKMILRDDLANIYTELIKEFNLISIEDPFNEDDFGGFSNLLVDRPELKVVADDLTVTNIELLKRAISEKSVNAIIIKPNQIGSLSEALDTMKFARENGIDCIVSHRSGETNDDFIADLAYAFGCYGLKSGAPLKEERAIKYKRLIEISKNK